MDDLKTTYNKIAANWNKDHAQDTWSIEGTNKFASFLSPGASVLDVGCAGGLKSAYLINRGFRVTGFDLSENMVNLAREHAPSGTFLVMDIRDLARLQETFDGILVQAVLLHIPKNEVVQVLQGLKDKLRPGGYMYVAVKESRPGGKEEEVVTEDYYGYECSRFFSYFTLGELKKYFDDLAMSIRYDTTVTFGHTNWLQIIVQK